MAKIGIIVVFHSYTPFIIYPILYTCELEFAEYLLKKLIISLISFLDKEESKYYILDSVLPEMILLK